MQRLRNLRSSSNSFSAANIKRKSLNSWAAIQDAFHSTKDTFERHRVVFTVGTSLASVATAFIGYSLRHVHETRVDERLQSIEQAMKSNVNLQHSEIKDIVGRPGGVSIPACAATAGTTLLIGYGLGWRGGSWYTTKKFKREQMKLLGQIKPRRWQMLGNIKPKGWQMLGNIKAKGWQFKFPRRSKVPDTAVKTSETTIKDASSTHIAGKSTTIKDASSTQIAGKSN